MKNQKPKEIRYSTKSNSGIIVGLIAIIGFSVAFIILSAGIFSNRLTGRVIDIDEGNLYGIILIVFLLLIASIAALKYLRKK